MKNITDIEVISINTVDGKMTALVSYRDLSEKDNINNGYDVIKIPVNIRPLRYSVNNNLLVNQSVRDEAQNQDITIQANNP